MTDYICSFNFQRETTRMKTSAPDREGALLNCLSILAKRYRVTKKRMKDYFSGDKDNYEIREVKNESRT
jgi:hypothetical protein